MRLQLPKILTLILDDIRAEIHVSRQPRICADIRWSDGVWEIGMKSWTSWKSESSRSLSAGVTRLRPQDLCEQE